MGRRLPLRTGALAVATMACAAVATAATVQSGGLRITTLAQIKPYKLPRDKPAPIAVFVAGHLRASNGGIPPQLQRLKIQVNKHGLLQSKGLPVCQVPEVQPASSERALQNCQDALIGSGRFWANIVLPEQGAYPTQGRLLIFNGRERGRPVILAHIFTNHPFNSSFVIPFSMKKIHEGPYGTELKASLPQALGNWGYLDRIKLTLKRKYRYRGRQLSYFNAACPALGNSKRASFPLAYAEFHFAGRKPMGATVNKTCGVKE
ncbi:MAG TPA: hypothetical protein VFW48_09715 [Solirubrobacterales bacterium]|nr:hypothetical protein [Solirubrobacterales bacterium]